MDDSPAGRVPKPVWDLPVRMFHWTLAGLIGFSWWSAEYGQLDWHFYSGFAVLSLLVFRLLYGFFGSSTARFANFVRGPGAVREYLLGSAAWKAAGHTPVGALSVLAMLGAIMVQVGLGLFAQDSDGFHPGPLARFLSTDTGDTLREVHELWFWVIAALIALHVGAILYYRLVAKKPLTRAMITGEGEVPEGAPPLKRAPWWVALLCLAAGLAFTRWLLAGAPPFGG